MNAIWLTTQRKIKYANINLKSMKITTTVNIMHQRKKSSEKVEIDIFKFPKIGL